MPKNRKKQVLIIYTDRMDVLVLFYFIKKC